MKNPSKRTVKEAFLDVLYFPFNMLYKYILRPIALGIYYVFAFIFNILTP